MEFPRLFTVRDTRRRDGEGYVTAKGKVRRMRDPKGRVFADGKGTSSLGSVTLKLPCSRIARVLRERQRVQHGDARDNDKTVHRIWILDPLLPR